MQCSALIRRLIPVVLFCSPVLLTMGTTATAAGATASPWSGTITHEWIYNIGKQKQKEKWTANLDGTGTVAFKEGSPIKEPFSVSAGTYELHAPTEGGCTIEEIGSNPKYDGIPAELTVVYEPKGQYEGYFLGEIAGIDMDLTTYNNGGNCEEPPEFEASYVLGGDCVEQHELVDLTNFEVTCKSENVGKEEETKETTTVHLILSPTADSDGDGVSDLEELTKYHTSPILADTDGDGYSDGEEITACSNPLDPSSIPGAGCPKEGGGENPGGGNPGGGNPGGGNPGGGNPGAGNPGAGNPGGGNNGGQGGNAGKKTGCAATVAVTFAVYRAMTTPKTNKCWTFDRPRGSGGFGQRRKWTGCGNEAVKAVSPEAPGYWFYDDTAGLLGGLTSRLVECARQSAREAKSGSFAKTSGYLFTAYRKGGRGYSLVPTSSELEGVRKHVTRKLTAFYQVYDAPDYSGSCPSFQPRCGSHPLITPALFAAWEARPAGLVPMIDATPGSWNTPAEVEKATLQACQASVQAGIRHIAINIGTGGSGNPAPVSGSYSAAISAGMQQCTS